MDNINLFNFFKSFVVLIVKVKINDQFWLHVLWCSCKLITLMLYFFLKKYRNYISRNIFVGPLVYVQNICLMDIFWLCFFCSYRREIEMHSNCEIYVPIWNTDNNTVVIFGGLTWRTHYTRIWWCRYIVIFLYNYEKKV